MPVGMAGAATRAVAAAPPTLRRMPLRLVATPISLLVTSPAIRRGAGEWAPPPSPRRSRKFMGRLLGRRLRGPPPAGPWWG